MGHSEYGQGCWKIIGLIRFSKFWALISRCIRKVSTCKPCFRWSTEPYQRKLWHFQVLNSELSWSSYFDRREFHLKPMSIRWQVLIILNWTLGILNVEILRPITVWEHVNINGVNSWNYWSYSGPKKNFTDTRVLAAPIGKARKLISYPGSMF